MLALQAITDLMKQHVTHCDNLEVWAEDGVIFSAQSGFVDGFELEYTVIVQISNALLAPQTVFMHLVNYLNQCDPERAEKGLAHPSFATEILDNGRCDLKIKLDLVEAYRLVPDEKGSWLQNGERMECVSEFTHTAIADDYGELIEFIGHQGDLP